MEELAEGEVLAGRYLLGPIVGHGAMGQVNLAEDVRLVRPVAVKSLRPELARYADVRQRFIQEARAAARISHPNVVRVYDSGEQSGIPFLVMECLPGSTLVDELAWGPLDPARARQVGLDVLAGLDAAHRLGTIHRDVKPGNILLSAALDGPVKVSDFGIAKSADDRSLTDSGSLVGTPAYLAPERVAGGPATPASDLYSVGVVLYEALAGRKPYDGETSLAVALAIHMGGAPGVLEARPDLDPALAEVVDRAIARHPAERWPSAAAMAEALRSWRPGAAAGRRSPRPNPLVAGAAGAAMGAAVAAAGARPAEAETAPSAVADPTRPLDPVEHGPVGGTGARTGGGTGGRAGGGTGGGSGGGTRGETGGGTGGGTGSPGRHRRISALACAGAAAVLLAVAVVAGLVSRRGGDPVEAPTATTTAALVAGPAAPDTVPDITTAAPPRAPVTTRPRRRPAAPATTARRPPQTRATSTTAAVATTVAGPPPTAPGTTAASPAPAAGPGG